MGRSFLVHRSSIKNQAKFSLHPGPYNHPFSHASINFPFARIIGATLPCKRRPRKRGPSQKMSKKTCDKGPRPVPSCNVSPNETRLGKDDYFPSTQASDVGNPLPQRIPIVTPKPSLGHERPSFTCDTKYFRQQDLEPRSSGFEQGVDVSVRTSFHDKFNHVD